MQFLAWYSLGMLRASSGMSDASFKLKTIRRQEIYPEEPTFFETNWLNENRLYPCLPRKERDNTFPNHNSSPRVIRVRPGLWQFVTN